MVVRENRLLPLPLRVTVFYLARQRYMKQTMKTIPIRYAIQSQEKSICPSLWRTTLGGDTMMNWQVLRMILFGTTEWPGLDIGFWIAMAVVALIVIIMNVVFWKMRPQKIKIA